MAIVGDRPSSGVRVALARGREASGVACVYDGFAHTPDASFPVHVRVAEDASVEVTVAAGATTADPPAGLGEKVRLLVRAAVKQAMADDEPPPLRITRWRGEK